MSTVLNSDLLEPLQRTLDSLDEVIHQKVRLGVMSLLVARGEVDFRMLRESLGLTDGNLSIHLAKLEDAGYVTVRKEFVRKRPHTSYSPTELGRRAFHLYLAALERIVKTAGALPGSGL